MGSKKGRERKKNDRKRSEETEASFVIFTKHKKKKSELRRNPAIIM